MCSNKLKISVGNSQSEEKDFNNYWKVSLYWGTTPKYPDGTYVVEFTSKGKRAISRAYLHHELIANDKKYKEIYKELLTFGPFINRNMLKEMEDYTVDLRKNGEDVEVSTEKLTSMLEGAYTPSNALETHRKFENSVLEDLCNYPTVSSNEYNPELSFGIRLDTPELKRKFGDYAIGVTKYTLMELFIWDDEPLTSRKEYMNSKDKNGYSKQLNEILQGWKDQGLLKKVSEYNRLNEWVKNPSGEIDKERFYIVKCEKVFEELATGKFGGKNE